MTEQEWLECTDPLPMLIYLRAAELDEQGASSLSDSSIISNFGNLKAGPGHRITPRQCRLFIAACIQRLRTIPVDDLSLRAISAYTRYATDRGSLEEFQHNCSLIWEASSARDSCVISPLSESMWSDNPKGAETASCDVSVAIANHLARDSVAETSSNVSEEEQWWWGFLGGPPDAQWQWMRSEEAKYQTELLRHIVGNPFRPVTVNPDWLTWNDGTVPKLATIIYDQWNDPQMPILGDALEDAGCDNEGIMQHCRAGGPHVRGCWVLDLLLGKS